MSAIGMSRAQAGASTYSMLLMSASCVSGLSRSHRPSARRQAADRAGHVQLLADDAQPGARRSGRAAGATRTFSSRSSCLTMPLPRVADERVLVRRLLQRPRRVPREQAERARTRRAGRRSGAAEPAPAAAAGARRQTTDTAPSTDSTRPSGASTRAALAQVQRRVGDVLDDGVRQHEIERAGRRTAAPCRRPARNAGCAAGARAPSAHARLAEAVDRIDADDLVARARRATAACRRRRSRRRARGRAIVTPARSRNAMTFALR